MLLAFVAGRLWFEWTQAQLGYTVLQQLDAIGAQFKAGQFPLYALVLNIHLLFW